MENERYDRLCSRISIYMKRQYASFSQSLKHCLSNVDKELKNVKYIYDFLLKSVIGRLCCIEN